MRRSPGLHVTVGSRRVAIASGAGPRRTLRPLVRTTGPGGSVVLRDLTQFALHMLRAVRRVSYPDGHPVRIRIGIHTGPVVAEIIGQKKSGYGIWGDTVNVATSSPRERSMRTLRRPRSPRSRFPR